MPEGHDRHVVICFAGLGDPRSFYLEALGESWLGLWCLWGGRGAPAAQIGYLSFPCGRECILGVSRGAGGPECYASCGGLWRAVAPCGGPLWPL